MSVAKRIDFSKTPKYSAKDITAIADECGIDRRTVEAEISLLEQAVDQRWQVSLPAGWQPSKVVEKLGAIERMAIELLKALGITDPDSAIDGLSDEKLLRAFLMGLPTDATDHALRHAIGGVASLAQFAKSARIALGEPSPEEKAAISGPRHRDAAHCAPPCVAAGLGTLGTSPLIIGCAKSERFTPAGLRSRQRQRGTERATSPVGSRFSLFLLVARSGEPVIMRQL